MSTSSKKKQEEKKEKQKSELQVTKLVFAPTEFSATGFNPTFLNKQVVSFHTHQTIAHEMVVALFSLEPRWLGFVHTLGIQDDMKKHLKCIQRNERNLIAWQSISGFVSRAREYAQQKPHSLPPPQFFKFTSNLLLFFLIMASLCVMSTRSWSEVRLFTTCMLLCLRFSSTKKHSKGVGAIGGWHPFPF